MSYYINSFFILFQGQNLENSIKPLHTPPKGNFACGTAAARDTVSAFMILAFQGFTAEIVSFVRRCVSITNFIAKAIFCIGNGLSYFFSSVLNTFSRFIERNYENNSAHSFGSFIFDQCSDAVSSLKIGCRNASYNGCGLIAAYNAALIKGVNLQPAQIINYYEKHGGIVLNGLLGVNPLVVKGLFTSVGLCASIIFFPRLSKLDSFICNSPVCVLMYAHKRGMHFVAIEFSNGYYRVYNAYSGLDSFYCCSSVEKWLKNTACAAVSVILLD